MTTRCCIAMVASLALTIPTTAGDPPFPIAVTHDRPVEGDRYCGLYCVYQAASLARRPIDLDRLIRTEYLTGEFGSTPQDIEKCFTEFGIRCDVVAGASYADLCLLGGPTLVLVKSSPEEHVPSHWVLVTRASPTMAEIFDPSVGVLRIDAAELQAVFGGPAVVVYREEEGGWALAGCQVIKVVAFAAVIATVLVVLRFFNHTRWHPAVVVSSTSVTLGLIAHTLDPAGFIWNHRLVSGVASAQSGRTSPPITATELLTVRDETVIVDARTPSQFEASHIPGSINVPYVGPYWKNKQILSSIPRNQRIVVYCNSKKCAWALMLGNSYLLHDFQQVQIMHGGISEYIEAGGKLERRTDRHSRSVP